jgi:hypothetical protein
LKDLTLDIEFDYSYVSDPPIFADIGTATLGVEQMTFGFTWTLDGELKLEILDMELAYGQAQVPADFDGLSDFSIVLTNTFNTVIDVVRNRAVSMLNSQLLTGKITAIGNKIISLLPEKIPLGPELYLEGVFAGPPNGDTTYVNLPLKTTLQSEEYPYDAEECNVDLPQVSSTAEY